MNKHIPTRLEKKKVERVRHQSLTHTHTLPPTPTLTAHQFPLFVYILPYLILLPYCTSSIPLLSSKKNIMGRPLFSTILSQQAPVEPIIHVAEPEHAIPICERWSISNSFDPDSDEFFAPGNTVYEAFLTEEEIAARERDNSTQVQQQQQQESSLQLPPPHHKCSNHEQFRNNLSRVSSHRLTLTTQAGVTLEDVCVMNSGIP